MVGTCNGLFCLSDDKLTYSDRLCLWNPCVRKLVYLPFPNVTYATHGGFDATIGFGFDPKTNDYKVVRLVTLLDSFDLEHSRTVAEIYSLSTGEWRMLGASLVPKCALSPRAPQAFVNGALHWVAFRRADDENLQHFVLVFDLGNEVFREILVPELPDYTSAFAGLLSVSVSAYGNSIALFQNGYFSLAKGCQTGDFYLWVMEEYGVASSWTKVLKIGEGLPRPIGFKRNGEEVVLLSHDWQLVSWVPWSTEFKHLEIIGYEDTFVDYYVESLVLLDKVANGTVTY